VDSVAALPGEWTPERRQLTDEYPARFHAKGGLRSETGTRRTQLA